jgi:DENN (AEX-3) domain
MNCRVGVMYLPWCHHANAQVDLYPLFRALSLKHIIILLEAAISEARIIFRSSYPAMLYSAARALIHLLWPLKYSGVFIPVLPSRLLSCLEVHVPFCMHLN